MKEQIPFAEVSEPIEHLRTGFECINCDAPVDPNTGSMFCSEVCQTEYNEDLKAELEDLRNIFKHNVLSD